MKNVIKIASTVLAALMLIQLASCTPEETLTEAPETTEIPDIITTDAVTETPAIPITEEGGAASVDYGGVKYKASGYESTDGYAFTVKSGFRTEFESGPGSFNRVVFSYSSSGPLKLNVTYIINSSEKTELFYLEEAELGTFRGLIASYLDGGLASQLVSAEVQTCKGDEARFMLYDVKTENVELLKQSTCYMENDRFKVGVKLKWGGGINYIEDKKCPVKGLSNLVNQHDTGRLVQQSYYGTAGNDEFTPGTAFDHTWVYNPVQGGDQFGNSSRLIDFEIKEDSIYIKAQPLDWAKKYYVTPTYMQNTYTLYEDCIRVDNRFIDFSGWEHRYTGQELPAFYTLSYLSRFTWYDGTEPWQDDVLSYKDDLNFWGDAKYVADCTMTLKIGNTETWCSWTSPESDYGVGLFVPNVDVLKAGKYNYNNSKKAENDATNYVAPVNTMKIISYKPIEYGYLITIGSVEQIRATFKANRDFADNASLHNDYISARIYGGDATDSVFDSEESVAALTEPHNSTVAFDGDIKAAKITAVTDSDPHVTVAYSAVSHDASEFSTLTVEYMIPADNKLGYYECDLFICAGQTTAPNGNMRLRKSLVKDGQFHTVQFDLSKLSYWSGQIHLLRFDYFDACKEGDVIYVRSFRLS